MRYLSDIATRYLRTNRTHYSVVKVVNFHPSPPRSVPTSTEKAPLLFVVMSRSLKWGT